MDAMKAFEGGVNQADISPPPSLSTTSPSSSSAQQSSSATPSSSTVWGTTAAAATTTTSTGSPYILHLSHQLSGIRGSSNPLDGRGVGSRSNDGNNRVGYNNNDDGYTNNNHIDDHISKSLRWTPIIGINEDNIDSDLQQIKIESSSPPSSSSAPPPVVQLLYPQLNYSKHNHSITATTAATATPSDMTATIEDAIEVVRNAIIIPIVEERFIMELYNKYALIMTTTTNNKHNKHKSSSSSTTTTSSLRCINSFRYFRFLNDFFITTELYSIKNKNNNTNHTTTTSSSSSYDSNGGNISSANNSKSNNKSISYGEVNIIYQEALRYNNNINVSDDKNSRGNNHRLHAYTPNNNLQYQKNYQSNTKSTNNHHHMNNHNTFSSSSSSSSSSSYSTDESKSSSMVGLNQIQFKVSLQAIALKLYPDVIIDEYHTPVEYLVGEMKKIAQRRAYELLLHERLIPIAVEYQGIC
jgi:hypothetical protein